MAYDLEKDIYRLLLGEAFFSAVSRHVQKVPSRHVPTAGVRITMDGNFEFLYNQDFMEKLSDTHRIGVLKHEFYHLILEHCLKRSPDGRKISMRWNLATDMSINCHLKNELPKNKEKDGFEAVFPSTFGYPDGLTAEKYYEMLEDDGKGEGGKCDGNHQNGEGQEGNSQPCDCGNFDNHEGWGEGNADIPQDIKDLAKERLKEAMREGV